MVGGGKIIVGKRREIIRIWKEKEKWKIEKWRIFNRGRKYEGVIEWIYNRRNKRMGEKIEREDWNIEE